jgi:hypothetical protein
MQRLAVVGVIATLLSAPAARAARVDVHVTDGRVELTSDAAPLSEILARLSQVLGFELEREGNVPNPLVPALELKGRTPVETVLSVLEGLGLDHALTVDESGTRVEKLLLVAASPPVRNRGGRSARPMPFSRRSVQRPPQRLVQPQEDWNAGFEPDADELGAPDAVVDDEAALEEPTELEPATPDEEPTPEPEGAVLPGGRLVTPGGLVAPNEDTLEEEP